MPRKKRAIEERLSVSIPTKQLRLLERLVDEKAYGKVQDIIRSLVEAFLKNKFPNEF